MQGKEKLGFALGLIEKLTLAPSTLSGADLRGPSTVPSRQAIIDVIYICAGFNIINRVADALGFDMPPPRAFAGITWFLLTFGYRLLAGTAMVRNKCGVDKSLAGLSKIEGGPRADLYSAKLEQLKRVVLASPGPIDSSARPAASRLEGSPVGLKEYLTKVAHAAYEVNDEDVAILRRAGYTDDEIFEATVRTAVSAGILRLESGLGILGKD